MPQVYRLVQEPVPVVVLGDGQLPPRKVRLKLVKVSLHHRLVEALDLFLKKKKQYTLFRNLNSRKKPFPYHVGGDGLDEGPDLVVGGVLSDERVPVTVQHTLLKVLQVRVADPRADLDQERDHPRQYGLPQIETLT